MKKLTITSVKAALILFASVEIAHALTPEGEFCIDLITPASYYFDAKAHGGVPSELLIRWLLKAGALMDFDSNGNSTDIIRELGPQVERGELTKYEAMNELFIPCVEKYRVQWN